MSCLSEGRRWWGFGEIQEGPQEVVSELREKRAVVPPPEIPVDTSRVEEKPSPEPRDPLNLYFVLYLVAGLLSTGMVPTRAE